MRRLARERSRRLDLHLHTNLSDGARPPDDVLRQCAQGGLDVVAITDHDLPPPLPAGEHLVGDRHVFVVHGVEVSGTHEGRELHLLVYFAGAMPDAFADFCRERASARAWRYDSAVASLGLPGLERADDDAHAGRRAIGRHHLARALVLAGHARTIQDAFDRYLRHAHGHVPLVELSFVDAIALAREYGGFTSWAHPSLEDAQAWSRTFAQAGLSALEAIRPGLGRMQRASLQGIAHTSGLGVTGGSDWHGWSRTGLGEFAFPERLAGAFWAAIGE